MDKTIDMARKAGAADIASHGWTSWVGTQSTEFLKRFEALVRADALANIDPSKFMSYQEGFEAGRFAERETFNTERQQYADWLDEAAADIEDWGMYASEYLQQKWDLPDQVQDYKNRAAAIRARGNI